MRIKTSLICISLCVFGLTLFANEWPSSDEVLTTAEISRFGAQFQDKGVVITGATGGIGRALALHFAQLGARVSLIARNQEKLDLTIAAIEGFTGSDKLRGHVADVTHLPEMKKVLSEIRAQGFPIDIVIPNAATLTPGSVSYLEDDDITSMVTTNLLGPIWTVKGLLPYFESERDATHFPAHIVYIASMAALQGTPAESVYSATKGGLLRLAEAQRNQYGPKGKVRISVVLPGPIDTPMQTKLEISRSSAQTSYVKLMFPKVLSTKPVSLAILSNLVRKRTRFLVYPTRFEVVAAICSQVLGNFGGIKQRIVDWFLRKEHERFNSTDSGSS